MAALRVTVALVALASFLAVAAACEEAGPEQEGPLVPVDSLAHEFQGNHLHGIGFDSRDGQLYLASHFGLFLLRPSEDGADRWNLYQWGETRDDYMGFSLHPTDPDMVYTSGHPATGGNLGVLRSDDAGLTFEQVFQGFDGEAIDFHSMTISPANAEVLYGYYWGDEMLYRTRDGGNTWERFRADGLPEGGPCWGAPCLAADPLDEDTLYAGTERGLLVSRDGGRAWDVLSSALTGPVAGVGVSSGEPPRILAMTVEEGVLGSSDGGETWEPHGRGLDLDPQEIVFAFAFDWEEPSRVFLATTEQRVFESDDAGASWRVILR